MSTLKYKKSQFIIFLILSFLFCAAAIVFMVNELVQNQAYFTRSFSNEQGLLVEQVANQAKTILTNGAGTEQDVIDDVIAKAKASGNRYWIFVRKNEILFYKNNFELEELQTKNISELIASFTAAGGHNTDFLQSLLSGKKNGAVMFSESDTGKQILSSVNSFEIDNVSYSIVMCTTENYILTAGKIVKHNAYTIMALILVCLTLFAVSIFGVIIISRKQDEILINEKTIRAKNIIIEELTESHTRADYMYNENTKLYGGKVLTALLKKADRPELYPFSIIFIQLEYSENITYDDLIKELVPSIHKILPKNGIAARVENNLLSIALFKIEYSRAKSLQKHLLKDWSVILKKLHTDVKTDVLTQFTGKERPIDIYESWKNKTSTNREDLA